ncbi:MAG: hypothetical protein AAF579_19220 [Cyanobacteria bacterium P01_C01_bin.118]
MTFQELKELSIKLPVSKRLALVNLILESLQAELIPVSLPATTDKNPVSLSVSQAIDQMRGLLKTDQPAPTDDDVKTILEERRVEKFS